MRSRLAPALLLGLVLLISGAARAAVAVPPLERRVTDLTGTLTPQPAAALEAKLAAFERGKGSQLAVLIVPTTEPETIEQYSIRVAEAWKLGRKGIDDGALLLVAKNDRALRIEVGYGLEGALPDAVANRIIDEIIVPHFKAGDVAGGIDAGLDAVIRAIDGEPLPAPQPWRSSRADPVRIQALFFLGFAVVVIVGPILRAILGRLPAATVVGLLLGFIALAVLASLIAAAVVALIGFMLTLFGAIPPARGGYRSDGAGGGGWGGGGFGGRGGGGFGGGGGGFGGGGASGRW
jgi:uncharacterized protein